MTLIEPAVGSRGGDALGVGGRAAADSERVELAGQPLVLVAGVGNSLLACDRIGPMVLESITDRYGGDVETCDIGCTALALLDHLRGQDLLVVVDACIGRGEPGEVFVTEPDLEALTNPGTSSHQVGPVEALVVAQYLWPERLPKKVLLLLVETGAMDEAVEAAAYECVINQLDREIDDWRQQRGRMRCSGASIGGTV